MVSAPTAQEEQERRDRTIRAARHTSLLEGSSSTEATRADQDAYVRGEIDVEQLGSRVRARYGLH
nr:antitoxin VbhA family protein [Nocardioides zeae]